MLRLMRYTSVTPWNSSGYRTRISCGLSQATNDRCATRRSVASTNSRSCLPEFASARSTDHSVGRVGDDAGVR